MLLHQQAGGVPGWRKGAQKGDKQRTAALSREEHTQKSTGKVPNRSQGPSAWFWGRRTISHSPWMSVLLTPFLSPCTPFPRAPSTPPRDHQKHLPSSSLGSAPPTTSLLPSPASSCSAKDPWRSLSLTSPKGERTPAFLCLAGAREAGLGGVVQSFLQQLISCQASSFSHTFPIRMACKRSPALQPCCHPAGISSMLFHHPAQGTSPSFLSAHHEVPQTGTLHPRGRKHLSCFFWALPFFSQTAGAADPRAGVLPALKPCCWKDSPHFLDTLLHVGLETKTASTSVSSVRPVASLGSLPWPRSQQTLQE